MPETTPERRGRPAAKPAEEKVQHDVRLIDDGERPQNPPTSQRDDQCGRPHHLSPIIQDKAEEKCQERKPPGHPCHGTEHAESASTRTPKFLIFCYTQTERRIQLDQTKTDVRAARVRRQNGHTSVIPLSVDVKHLDCGSHPDTRFQRFPDTQLKPSNALPQSPAPQSDA